MKGTDMRNAMLHFRTIVVICLLFVMQSVILNHAQAEPIYSAELEFEMEGFDLETGAVVEDIMMFPFLESYDFHFAYNADWTIHAVLFQEYPAQIAFLDEVPFSDVSYDDIQSLTFTTGLIDQSFENDDTIIIYTSDEHYYKIGNALENLTTFTVTFDYQNLHAPEPATCVVLGAGLLAVIARRRPRS